MKKSVLWITRTAVMLALLIALQWITKPLGQIVTGSAVNAVLAVTVLLCGYGSGVTVALLSPVCAYLAGIAPQIVTVPAIMAGNAVFVLLLRLLSGKPAWKKIIAWIVAAAAKFGVLYALVVWVICGCAAGFFLGEGMLKEPMIAQLTVMFAWPQLITALIGGGAGMLIHPLLNKAIRSN